MNETDLLKKILDAENSGRELAREAEKKAEMRLREAASRLEDDYNASREARAAEISRSLREYEASLSAAQAEKLSAFDESLAAEETFPGDARLAVRRILSLP
ncbi:MAG: hypothetical protein LBC67_01045 [Spirochaetales bacterium]|nr:hypothetical protein [Spirochaetales bacterium]